MTHLNVALTLNWEGRSLSGVESIVRFRERFPQLPVTHFISAAYFARGGDYGQIVEELIPAFRSFDEVGLLINCWDSVHGVPAGDEEPRTVISGPDPLLEVDYAGIRAQVDSGYTRALSSCEAQQIDAWIRSSRLLIAPLLKELVRRMGISVDAVLRGARVGHSMASDLVLDLLEAAGFDYEASGVDATWAWRQRERISSSPFGPWPEMLAGLWGPTQQSGGYLSNTHCYTATAGTGIDWRTQPFMIIADDARQLLEMPINGGIVPPAVPNHVLKIANALTKFPSPSGTYFSFGIHQDTADTEFMAMIEEIVAQLDREYGANWSTLATIADGLRYPNQRPAASMPGVRPVPRPGAVPRPTPVRVPTPPPIRYPNHS